MSEQYTSGPQSSGTFRIGGQYSRADIYRLLQVPGNMQGGDWDTGYHQHEKDWFIFAGVGTSGRTGHDYGNSWQGSYLVWRGKTNSRLHHRQIESLLNPPGRIHLFTRSADRHPFTFHGTVRAIRAEDTSPVTITWELNAIGGPGERSADEVLDPEWYLEGARRVIQVNAYERNSEARRKCLEHYGPTCQVCGFDFESVYGDLGCGFIHVHHHVDLALRGQEYQLDPVSDLIPVCPNCHAMLHTRVPAMSVRELRERVRARRR